MTPKEKAKELCEHYSKLVLYSTNSFDKKLVPEIRTFVKQCALIAVDEIEKAFTHIRQDLVNYWQEVKQEIEEL